MSVLNECLRRVEGGPSKEADSRHWKQISNSSNCVATLGLKALQPQTNNDVPIPTGERSVVAYAAEYLASHRIDVRLASEEVNRFMGPPSELSNVALQWLGRYLLCSKRLGRASAGNRLSKWTCSATRTWPGAQAREKRKLWAYDGSAHHIH